MRNFIIDRRLAAAFLTLTFVTASHAVELTPIGDRDSRVLMNETKRLSTPMQPSEGKTPQKLDARPIACDLPARSEIVPAGVPRAPGSTQFNPESMARFLQLGLTQSYNKSYEVGWRILDTHVRKALTCLDTAPRGVQLALETAREAASSQTYQCAYEILKETMVSLSRSSMDFAGAEAAASLLALGRRCGYEKSLEQGWRILNAFARAVRGSGLLPSQQWDVALGAALDAGSSQTYQCAYQVLHTTFKHLEQAGPAPLGSFYFQMALDSAAQKSYEQGWRILNAFTRAAVKSGMLDDFQRTALETSLENTSNKTYQTAYEILRDALAAMR